MVDSSDDCMIITEVKPGSRKRKNSDRTNLTGNGVITKFEQKFETKHEANFQSDKKYGAEQMEKLKLELLKLDSTLTSLNSESQKPSDERHRLKTKWEKERHIYAELETKFEKIHLKFEEKIHPEWTEKESGYKFEEAETRSEVLKSETELEILEKTSYFTNDKLLSGEYKNLVENFPNIYLSFKTFVENSKSRDDLYSEILLKTWDDLFESDLLEKLKQEERVTRQSFPTSQQSEINEKAKTLAQLEAKLKKANFKHETDEQALVAVNAEYRKVENKTSDCQNSIENVEKNIEKLKSNLKSKAENIESAKESNANKIVDQNAQYKGKFEEKVSDICKEMNELGVSVGKHEDYVVIGAESGEDDTVKNDKVKEISDFQEKLNKISKEYSTGYEPNLTFAKFKELEKYENAIKSDLVDHRRRNQCEYYKKAVGKPPVVTDEWLKRAKNHKYFTDKLIEMEKKVQELQKEFKKQTL